MWPQRSLFACRQLAATNRVVNSTASVDNVDHYDWTFGGRRVGRQGPFNGTAAHLPGDGRPRIRCAAGDVCESRRKAKEVRSLEREFSSFSFASVFRFFFLSPPSTSFLSPLPIISFLFRLFRSFLPDRIRGGETGQHTCSADRPKDGRRSRGTTRTLRRTIILDWIRI